MNWFLRMIGIVCSLGVIECCSDMNTDTTPPEEGGEIDGAVYSTHYVQQYIDVDLLSSAIHNENSVRIYCAGQAYGGGYFADRYGDNGFNRNIGINSTRVILNCFTAIDLVWDSDFDDCHKAGVSLADIAFVAGVSPYKYIKSGYIETFDWKNRPAAFTENSLSMNFWSTNFPIYRRLSEVSGEDLALMERMFYLVFEVQPTLSKTHKMTLTVTDNAGRKIPLAFDWKVAE